MSAFSQPVEYTLKAVYIEKFTRFIEWPDSCNMDDKEKPFIIATLGETPFKKSLNNIFSIQKIYEKPVKIIHLNSPKPGEKCHILFISGEMQDIVESITDELGDKPVLTIGDTPGYCKKGVLINFFIEDDKLYFAINEESVEKSPLDFSFYLLNMAKIVKPLKNQ